LVKVSSVSLQDLLKGHLARFSRAANALMPTTFTLPREYVAFVRAFSEGRTDVTDPSEKALLASKPALLASKTGPDGIRPEGVSENGPEVRRFSEAPCLQTLPLLVRLAVRSSVQERMEIRNPSEKVLRF
jgi:hypothetical protein